MSAKNSCLALLHDRNVLRRTEGTWESHPEELDDEATGGSVAIEVQKEKCTESQVTKQGAILAYPRA